MNKKLITLAVAAAMVAPAAAMAEATLYGKLHNSIDYVDVDNFSMWGAVPSTGPGPSISGNAMENGSDRVFDNWGFVNLDGDPLTVVDVNDGYFEGWQFENLTPEEMVELEDELWDAIDRGVSEGRKFTGWDLNANGRANRIGVKGSEDLGGGLKAIYQVEFQVRLTDANNNVIDNDRGSVSMRNSFVGLAGGWGTFLVGRHDTPFKISSGKLDLFADTLADYNHTVGFQDLRADNAVAYISPSFSGLQFAGAVVPAGGSTGTGVFNEDADSISEAYSLALIYSNGPFYASAAYENLGDALFDSLGDSYQRWYGNNPDDDTKWRIGLGLLDWNGFTLTGIYEDREHVNGAPKKADQKLWQIQAGYAFGNNMIKAMYGQADVDECIGAFGSVCSASTMGTFMVNTLGVNKDDINNDDKSTWAVGFDHNFSKRTKAYMLYTEVNDDIDDADWSGFSLGMIHSF